ncbi:MAG TPA: malonyl-CoA synthase [Rhizomicrobium sp.]|jgi:malonyl-CoA/methylmalonyl-CoA synthetase|nr:malonyl-CoA synthase [Rhizomicrobium sp.]
MGALKGTDTNMDQTPHNSQPPGGASLFAAIRSAAPDGSRVFIRDVAGHRLTYHEMYAETARIANCLVAAGLRPGDRLAVQVEKSVTAILVALACMRAGAIFLPLSPAYTLAELEYFLADAEPSCVVVQPGKQSSIGSMLAGKAAILTLDSGGKRGSLIDGTRGMPDSIHDVPRTADDLAAILYTSGTTGRSKGAMLTHYNLVSNALTLRDLWRFTRDDVLLHALPVYHTHGLFTATNTVLMAGASMVFLPRFDAELIFAHLPGCTTMMGVPTFYTRLLADPRLTREAAAHMRVFISGSAPLLPETHREWFDRTGHAILERYGMTETNMIASNPYDGERRAGAVGYPLPGVDLRVVDGGTGEALPDGEIGMIELRGPNVCKGYWRKPEQTAETFRGDGFFVTGDLGRINADGYLEIVGRAKDLVITGGFNVYPREVEFEIDAIPGVVESAVIGVPHPDFGEGVTAVIVRKRDVELSESVILEALRERLAKFKLPKRVVFRDVLPRNAMGKVQKNELRNIYRDLYVNS